MALQKSIPTNTGYAANYFIINSVNVSFKQKALECVVIGYKDAATRENVTAQPLYMKRFEIKGNDFTFSNQEGAELLWKQVYDKLKTLPEFLGAENV